MAEHLKSLKRKRENAGDLDSPDEDFFPLSLFLSEEEIETLGVGNMELGNEREMVFIARATSISSNEREGGKKRSNMELTLVEGASLGSSKSQAERLFGGNDGGDK